ncbi:MAG: PhzF family phenazine biosynthesis protein [Gaiellales bacterium]
MHFQILDVFTDTPLAGNQLAVFPNATEVPEHLLQPLAREINFSETVFVYPPMDPANTARIRIFVPVAEVPFAGHPVLGTAVALAAQRNLSELRLETGQGVVPVTVTGTHGSMRQPLPSVAPYANAEGLLQALGVQTSELPVEVYDNGLEHVYVTLPSVADVLAIRPNTTALVDLEPDSDGVVGFNCMAGAGDRYTTRMFAPADGVAEDPATGSAAGPLACHLARHGRIGWGQQITISQGEVIGRPSTLLARAEGSAEGITGVEVAGDAVLVGDGAFSLPG